MCSISECETCEQCVLKEGKDAGYDCKILAKIYLDGVEAGEQLARDFAPIRDNY